MAAKAIERLERGLADEIGVPVELERPSNPEHGDYAPNAAMRAAPLKRKSPMEIAEEIRAAASALPGVLDAAVAPPGFVNLQLDPAWYGEALAEILSAGADYGGGSAAAPEKVQVEFVSANPTGPLTVASARNAAYGDSVARLLGFAGHTVEREFYVNDAGAQIDLFRESVEARRRGEEPPAEGYQGEYVGELAALEGDAVVAMEARIRETLERFRVHMDLWVHQSAMEEVLEDALGEIELYESDGARWLATTAWGDDKDRVVVRADGRPTYFAVDVPHMRLKWDRGHERLIYVLGADHHGYIARLKAIAGALGHDPEHVEVLIYQLVHLIEGGEARKVSKRRGDVVFLDELLDEIGVDAARWHLVSRGHEQAMDIDVDLARERTEKNPVYYVQYAHARIAGILRNAEGRPSSPEPPGALASAERELVKRLAEFPAVVAEATERRGPHALPTYAIRVADDFHRFYHDHRVLESEEEPFRLALCRATASVIARALDLMGVEAPERM
jgi:arginyl-tRNA synthetase